MEKFLSVSKSMMESRPAFLPKVGAGFLGLFSVWKLSQWIEKLVLWQKLQTLIKETQQHRSDVAEKLRVHLETILQNGETDLESVWESITRLSVPELRELLQADKTTAVEVVRAFQWSALKAHKATNCVTEFFEEAEALAFALDAQYGHTQYKPPLFGIPISVKDNLQVQGHRSTAGMASYLDHQIPNEDAILVAHLRSLGAVPFLHTNVPQTMLSLGCFNPVFGITGHPFDIHRTPGGSTGGEGALLALHGSPLGLGSDIGGSIRVPSHYCGLAGFKPTSARVTRVGSKPVMTGVMGVAGTWGPMSRDVDSLVLMLENIWKRDSPMFRDPYTTPIPFQHDMYNYSAPMTIGYYMGDGNFEVLAVPACARAVLMAKKALESRGHKLVPWSTENTKRQNLYLMKLLSIDGGRYLKHMLDQDIMEPLNKAYPHFSFTKKRYTIGRHFSSLLGLIWPRYGKYLREGMIITTSDARQTFEELINFRAEFTKAWASSGLDGIICCPNPSAALPHEFVSRLSDVISSTGLYNVLDYPAGVVPCTSVMAEDEKATRDRYPEVVDEETTLVRQANVRGSIGLPVGVQCVALPFKDEMCLHLMKELELGLKET